MARASRLLKYNLIHDLLTKYANTVNGYRREKVAGAERIIINKIRDDCFGTFIPSIEDLRGITFYCDKPGQTELWINGQKISQAELQLNGADWTGRASIGIKWFQPDYTDYTVAEALPAKY